MNDIEREVRKVIGGIDWHEVFDVPPGPPLHDDLIHIGVKKAVATGLESVRDPDDG